MTRFAFTIEYDGRPFMGWQRQAHGPTVQQHIEEALSRIVGTAPILHCAGRTDAGVHALAMRAHADLDKAITPFRLMEALNAHLRPVPIAIVGCETVPDDWHARFSCTARAYEYRILNRRAPLTFEDGLVWRVPKPLDAAAMQAAAQILVGRHDFTTFRSTQCQADSPIRTLQRLDVMRVGERITIHAQARSFLHHQVRSMTGCLALVGMGTWAPAQMRAALEARDRAALGHNAPPDGLYFMRADYPDT
jgi:tRNA pseudouridine38-40 synthase